MSYTRVNWKNGQEGGTPIDANNLNVMDSAIAGLDSTTTIVANDVATLGRNFNLFKTETNMFKQDVEDNYATKTYVTEQIGTIGAVLDAINRKVV